MIIVRIPANSDKLLFNIIMSISSHEVNGLFLKFCQAETTCRGETVDIQPRIFNDENCNNFYSVCILYVFCMYYTLSLYVFFSYSNIFGDTILNAYIAENH